MENIVENVVNCLVEEFLHSHRLYIDPDLLLFDLKKGSYTFGFDAKIGKNMKMAKELRHVDMGLDWSEEFGLGRIAYDEDDNTSYLSMWEPGRIRLSSGESYWLNDGLEAFKTAIKTMMKSKRINRKTIVPLSYSVRLTVGDVLAKTSDTKVERPVSNNAGEVVDSSDLK